MKTAKWTSSESVFPEESLIMQSSVGYSHCKICMCPYLLLLIPFWLVSLDIMKVLQPTPPRYFDTKYFIYLYKNIGWELISPLYPSS